MVWNEALKINGADPDFHRRDLWDAVQSFELSKCEKPEIRIRIVSHLMNIHDELAGGVAGGLGLEKMPEPAEAAMPTKQDLKHSPALSIVANGPKSFAGRKIGVLVSDGVDIATLKDLKKALEAEGAAMEIVAPTIFGVKASDGTHVDADEKVDGGPSVLYDAVAVLPTTEGAGKLAAMAPGRDFVSDAFAHMKFVAYVDSAEPLLERAGVRDVRDGGFFRLDDGRKSCDAFVAACRDLRFWDREMASQG